MTERIAKLAELTLKGEMHPQKQAVEYDRKDLFLPHHARSAKRIYAYITAQQPVLTPMSAMTGLLLFDDSVEGDSHSISGLVHTEEAIRLFKKPIENLSTMEWQHATADFSHILPVGLEGVMARIAASKKAHAGNEDAQGFLDALHRVAEAIIAWANKCADAAESLAKTVEDPKHLLLLSETLRHIPAKPAKTFYEAVLCIYVLFSYCPDSLGTLDRTLRPYYEKDMAAGTLTKNEAKEYLQELYLMLQAKTDVKSRNFTRGGESHFCVGGYDGNGNDTFDDFSMLIVEAMEELPTYIPQISLRWTKKTPFEVFRKLMDMERKDPNKRIAFVNDEVKLAGFTDYFGIPFQEACTYSSIGCNEVAFPGGFFAGTSTTNALRCMENTLYNRKEDILKAESFEEFFAIFKQELTQDLDKIFDYDNKLNLLRAKDTSYVSCLMFDDCIKNADSYSRGAVKKAVCVVNYIGIANVIDSLCTVKHHVFDKKTFSMAQLLQALADNWQGHEALLAAIEKETPFFGNDDETSNAMADLLLTAVYDRLKDKRNAFGYKVAIGNLIGYVPHHQLFGQHMRATPDGRHDGDNLKFGIGQSGGHDRKGLTALLASIAKCDRHRIMTTSSVTNITVEPTFLTREDSFETLCEMLETYFLMGGSHFQVNGISRKELLDAKKEPEKHTSLRVRVSGFSEFFVRLIEPLQDDVIARTV